MGGAGSRRRAAGWTLVLATLLGGLGGWTQQPAEPLNSVRDNIRREDAASSAETARSVRDRRDHTRLERSDPAAAEVLAEAPSAVTLDFSTDVQLALSTVTVRLTMAEGVVSAGELAYLARDQRDVLVLPISEALANGAYTVAWVTAGPDGHSVTGKFGFAIDAASPPDPQEPDSAGTGPTLPQDTSTTSDPQGPAGPTTTAPPDEGSARQEGVSLAGPLAVASRVFFYVGIIGLLGALAFRFLVLAPLARAGAGPGFLAAATGRTWAIAATSVAVLLASLPFRLWVQAQLLFPGKALENLGALTTQTAWGGGWWLHAGATFVALAGVAFARPAGQKLVGWVIAGAGALALPMVTAVSGHAWAAEPRPLAVAALCLHVVAASAWAGGLFCLLAAGLPSLKSRGEESGGTDRTDRTDRTGGTGLATLVSAFSRVAVVAVGLVVATGAANAWLHLEAVSQLWGTPWGRALCVKLGLAGATMALGLYNWRVVRPALAESPRPGLLAGPAFVELAFAAAVLVATSLLVVQPLGN